MEIGGPEKGFYSKHKEVLSPRTHQVWARSGSALVSELLAAGMLSMWLTQLIWDGAQRPKFFISLGLRTIGPDIKPLPPLTL